MSQDLKEKQKKEAEGMTIVRLIFMASQLGFLIAVPLIGLMLLGIWLDKIFNLSPCCTLIFIGLSFVVIFFELRGYFQSLLKKKS